ncbi:cupredoxin domain-containing protein [Bacillus haimaensis]|uniref:cupredoxin domain-containing protein n=1 Tax=Bacillus haimaensis TaxID=3160967 RepID=UPI003AA9A520
MINSYTRFAATVLMLQVVTIAISGAFVLKHFPPIHVMNGVIAIIIAAVLLKAKWKWTPIFGILYGLLFSILTVPSFIISMFRSIDPEYNAMREASNPFFGISFLTALLVLTVLISSIAGLLANQGRMTEDPSWFPKLKAALYGATTMALLASIYLQLHWVTGVNASTIEQLPTIVMKPDSAEPATMEITEGEPLVLRIINESDNACHIFSFPELDASVHMERDRTGLLVIDPEPGTYTYQCKPHHDYVNENIKGMLTVHPK